MGRTIEHCFFHVGEFDLEKPDKVFLRLMQRAQADDLGLVLIENRERFPLTHQAQIPQMDVYFVQEQQQEVFGFSGTADRDGRRRSPIRLYIFRFLVEICRKLCHNRKTS